MNCKDALLLASKEPYPVFPNRGSPELGISERDSAIIDRMTLLHIRHIEVKETALGPPSDSSRADTQPQGSDFQAGFSS